MAGFLIRGTFAALALSALGTTGAHAADAGAGRTYFKSHCAVCHGDTANSPPGIGPRLFGVVGRKAGTFPGFHYSSARAAAGFAWTPEQLRLYVASPQGVVKGNKMPFPGIAGEGDRANVVAYLQTLR